MTPEEWNVQDTLAAAYAGGHLCNPLSACLFTCSTTVLPCCLPWQEDVHADLLDHGCACGVRKDEVVLQRKALREPCGIRRFSTDGWGAYERSIDPEQRVVGTQHTPKIASTHINLRTQITRLVRRTICFATTTTMHDLVMGLCIHRSACGLLI